MISINKIYDIDGNLVDNIIRLRDTRGEDSSYTGLYNDNDIDRWTSDVQT